MEASTPAHGELIGRWAVDHRDAMFAADIAGLWPDPADNADGIRWVRDYHDAPTLHPSECGYVDVMSDDGRLARIKGRYDPHHLVHLDQDITPER